MNRRGVGCGCFGCGGGTLLVLVLVGVLAWNFVVQPARSFLAGWQPPAQTQSQTGGAVTATGDVTAAVTRSDIEKFVQVRREVRTALGTNFSDLNALWQGIQQGQTPTLIQVVNTIRQTGGSVQAARAAQAQALARENLSPQRYAVIRSAVNRALGLPSIDFAQAANDLQNGRVPDLNRDVQTATAQERQLTAPYQRELTETAAMGLLDL
ncbi:hypothetical protein [uncultured Deinococcus sp.]|uniref:hypothetical protein n=1 Tax=uncultured Deinococcus sp. TaxID=158789 RepID=UPI00258BDE85|nr:hypothetical protein [uncultured Deinococcus sp.]